MSLSFRIHREATVTSTNDSVKRRGMRGEAEGLAVVAEAQTGGKGRSGNIWVSPPGGLYMSILLRPDLEPEALLGMTVFSCVPVAKAIENVTGAKISLKWPNDLEIDGKKVGGILVEGVSRGGKLDFAVVGIGINANAEPSAEETPNAIFLRKALGKQVGLDELAMAILSELAGFYDDLANGGLREEYLKRSTTIGRKVEISSESGTVRGTARGVGEDGSLLLHSDDGSEIAVRSATGVSLRASGGRGGA